MGNWLFGASTLTPHGFCLSWEPGLIALHAGSDAVIALSYLSIPVALVWLMRKRGDLRSVGWVIYAFIIFILACGATHVFGVLTLWVPAYGLEGLTKLLTAIASLTTATILWPLVPRLAALPTPTHLERMNSALRSEIDGRQRVEQALREANAVIATKNQELEAFTYSVAHDLRTPLRGIDGFSHILLEDHGEQLDPEGRAHLEVMRQSVKHMGSLIDDLLSLARVSGSEFRPSPVDLAEIAGKIAIKLKASEPDRPVTWVAPAELPHRGDTGLLTIALENLLSNAWKFTRDTAEPRIELGSLSQDGKAVYFVADNGAGFDMAYSGKLFAAFQRLHAVGEFAGTGIGLSTVQRIIHRHGGRIWAEAEVGRGATFFFTLGED